ncbi:MAG: hypothetical protein J6X62_02195 [Bacteroidales bacterium]|nr:hypothetical protein [Bacteroidales bacterium]
MKANIFLAAALAVVLIAGCKKEEVQEPVTPTPEPEKPAAVMSLSSTTWNATDTINAGFINIVYSSNLVFTDDRNGSIDVYASLIQTPRYYDFTYTFDGNDGVFTTMLDTTTYNVNFHALDSNRLRVAVNPALLRDSTGLVQQYTGGNPINITYTKVSE